MDIIGTKILSPMKSIIDPNTKVVYTKNPDKEYFKSNNFDYVIVVPFVDTVDTLVAAWVPGSNGQGFIGVLFGDYGFTRKLVFHEMVNAGVEPNVHTYGALIDGCAKAGQVAKAFGAYGIMRSKNVKPDRVVFNALISACGQSGAVDRAFDVLSEMNSETHPIDPDHITVGALMKACMNAGQVERAREINWLLKNSNQGTPEVYTIALYSCTIFFVSALIDVAGHADLIITDFQPYLPTKQLLIPSVKVERKNEEIQFTVNKFFIKGPTARARAQSSNYNPVASGYFIDTENPTNPRPGANSASSHDDTLTPEKASTASISVTKRDPSNTAIFPIVTTKSFRLHHTTHNPNCNRVSTERAKDSVLPHRLYTELESANLTIFLSPHTHHCDLLDTIHYTSSSQALVDKSERRYDLRKFLSDVCAFPFNLNAKKRSFARTTLGVDGNRETVNAVAEAASLGIVPGVSLKESPIVVDVTKLPLYTAERVLVGRPCSIVFGCIKTLQVYFLTVLKGLRHRLAAGVKLPNISILLPVAKTQIKAPMGDKTINVAGR
ncbi:pentatricopeptide repeat-containing protein MRL1, chloroplastic isoform X1 [Tanacetum coccineum]